MEKLLTCFGFLVLFSVIVAQERCIKTDNGINEEVTSCSECLWTEGCKWCEDSDTTAQVPVGGNKNKISVGCIKSEGTCSKVKKSIVPGDNTNRDVEIRRVLQGGGQDSTKQLQPQKLQSTVKINPTTAAEVLFKIQPAKDHPVDLYFVMDLSNSMKPYKENLVASATAIAETIQRYTESFRMGFGSFSDKPTAPFSAELSYYNNGASAPFAFHHVQDLTNRSTEFIDRIKTQETRGNVDSPESGMDALMQAIVCEEHIWKQEAKDGTRKIIIFITDQSSHYALDGLLGGIVTPADEECHLVECLPGNDKAEEGCAGSSGIWSYADQLTRDYPSFSQVRKVINDKNMNVIFAVTEFMKPIYDKLAAFLGQGENVGTLPKIVGKQVENADALKNLIKDQYESITSSARVTTGQNEEVSISFKQMATGGQTPSSNPPDHGCPDYGTFTENVFECDKTKNDKEIWAKAFLSVTKEQCKDLNGGTGSEELKLFGFDEEKMDITYKCEQCDQCNAQDEVNAPECSSKGDLICGGCKCKGGFKGRFCQCDPRGGGSIDQDQCKMPGKDDLCSNRGECNCGSCQCKNGYTGQCCQIKISKFCGAETACNGHGDCKEISSKNKKCEANAECSCHKVKDNKGSTYSGEHCECCEKGECKNKCFDRFSNPNDETQVCSGHGKCGCNNGKNGETCECDSGWSGEFCQIRDDNLGVCELLEPCIRYRMTGGDSGSLKQSCKENLEQLGYKGEKAKDVDASRTRIACQPSSNGKLNNKFYLLKEHEGKENTNDYCSNVLETVTKSQIGNNVSNDETSSQENYLDIEQEHFKQCEMDSVRDSSCKAIFYHNDIEGDEHFKRDVDGTPDIQIYVVQHNGTEEGKWQYQMKCNPIPVTTILISTIGTFFAICLGMLISAVVIININDYRRFKQYEAQVAEANKLLEMENPKFRSPTTTTMNPMH